MRVTSRARFADEPSLFVVFFCGLKTGPPAADELALERLHLVQCPYLVLDLLCAFAVKIRLRVGHYAGAPDGKAAEHPVWYTSPCRSPL